MGATDLVVRLLVDESDLDRGFKSAEGSVSAWQGGLDRAAGASAVVIGGLAAAAVVTGNAAAEAEQASGAVASVFGDHAQRVLGMADAASQAVGLTAAEYNNLAAVVGSQFTNMGVPMGEVAGKTDQMIALGADLAATYGGTTADAVAALSSLLRGETDPIERYGVSIKEADISAQLAAMGLSGLEGEAGKAARTQALLGLLTTQTSDAQGQFAREADTAAGAQQRANAAWGDATAALGEALLPVMATAAGVIKDVGVWVRENTPLVTTLAVGIGVLAGAVLVVNGVMKGYAAIQAIQTAAQWASNAAWLASPVTWIILAIIAAIAGLVAAGIWLVSNWDGVVKFFGEAWTNISNGAGAAFDWIGDRMGGFVDGFLSIPDRIAGGFQWLGDTVFKIAHTVATAVAWLWNNSLGKIAFDVPGLVPFIGGQRFAVPQIVVPALAAGGIVTSATLALIGEAGPEAVVPLPQWDAMRSQAGAPAPAGSYGDLVVEVHHQTTLDGRTIYESVERHKRKRR